MAKRKSPRQTPEAKALRELRDRRTMERLPERCEIDGEHEMARLQRKVIRRRYGPRPEEAGDQATA